MAREKGGKPSLSQRLSGRAAGLARKSMPDGGEVYSGALASKALKSVGARAMTMDGSIFVNEGFGSSAEDKALYAHETVHKQGSGGADKGDHNHGHDPEEVAARAVERMVLHKSRAGEDFGETLAKIRDNMPRNNQEAEKQIKHAMRADSDGDERDQSMMGYWAMRSQGLKHHDITRMLGEATVQQMSDIENSQNERTSDQNTF